MFDMSGKSAVVTGAGSGIGRAIAQALAGAGADVALWDLDEGAAEETGSLIEAAGGAAAAVCCDITDASAVEEAVERAVGRRGRIDLLVNNAGIGHVGNLEKTSSEDLDRLYAVNVKGMYHCLHAVVPRMAEAGGGAVVNLASIASLIGVKDRFAYSMTKGAVLTMTYSVAIDYAERGVRCNCICPARVHTPFVDSFLAKNYPGEEKAMFEKLSAYQPLGRMAEPDEVAAMALYLCSDEASFITGNAFPIDGGVINAR